jgi:MFS family permease
MVWPPPIFGQPDIARRPLRHLFRRREFLLLYASWALATTALFVPFVFLPAFARDHGASEIAAAALVSLIGGTSIVGRLVLGPIGDRVDVLRLFKITTMMMAISYAIWLFSASYVWLVVFAVVLGTNYGSRIAAALIELFGLDNLGTTLGVFFTATGVAALLGPPLAGIAVDLSGSYYGAILFALAAGLLGFAAIAPLGSPQLSIGMITVKPASDRRRPARWANGRNRCTVNVPAGRTKRGFHCQPVVRSLSRRRPRPTKSV